MNKKHLVLFDMDGTLSEPRKLFDRKLLPALRELALYSEIGIVTGSDYDYLSEQMKLLIKYSELRYETHLLPCNGTKYYPPPKYPDDGYEIVHNMDMQEYLGKSCFRQLIMILSARQGEMCYTDIPLTGHFISYRGSMINWCPIGRNANEQQREEFVKKDTEKYPTIRMQEMDRIRYKINIRCKYNVSVKIGGDTSLDIYPEGWDKTYALKHFPDHTCWFVGDKCDGDGNDREIYELLEKEGRGFKTTGPANTNEIIKQITNRIKNDQ